MRITPKQGSPVRKDPINTILTLEEMKGVCYIEADCTDDDTLLGNMELAARNQCEHFTARPLLTSTNILYYSYSDIYLHDRSYTSTVLNLPWGNLQTINDITIWDTDNVGTVLESDTYQASTTGECGQVFFIEPPFGVDCPREIDYLSISITGGFGDTADDVPYELKQGMLFLIAMWYEHREDQSMGSIPSNVKAMWSPWKLQRFK